MKRKVSRDDEPQAVPAMIPSTSASVNQTLFHVENSFKGEIRDWSDEENNLKYTVEILKNKYNINIVLSADRLCPTLTSRLNYLNWINYLLEITRTHKRENKTNCRDIGAMSINMNEIVSVLDIGTGSSCIYPLLGSRLYGWKFLASELDELSFSLAQNNVNSNSCVDITLVRPRDSDAFQAHLVHALFDAEGGVNTSARLREVVSALVAQRARDGSSPEPRGPLLQALLRSPLSEQAMLSEQRFVYGTEGAEVKLLHVSMCNPPFFASEGEQLCARRNTRYSFAEYHTRGGELGFFSAMLSDSLVLRTGITWYSCLLGKKSSLSRALLLLRLNGLSNIRSTRFTQGRTMRWGVAWSLTDIGENLISDFDKALAWSRLKNRISRASDSRVRVCDSWSLRELSRPRRTVKLSLSQLWGSLTHQERVELKLEKEGEGEKEGEKRQRQAWAVRAVAEERAMTAIKSFSSVDHPCATKMFTTVLEEGEEGEDEEDVKDDEISSIARVVRGEISYSFAQIKFYVLLTVSNDKKGEVVNEEIEFEVVMENDTLAITRQATEAFAMFCDKIEQDIKRTNRKWRRLFENSKAMDV